jgi:adenylyl cyclase-associated protein
MAAPMLPAPFLQDGPIDGHIFWSNKVRKANKDREGGENHILWCTQIKVLLENLKVYVKAHHTTGVSWNARGGNCADFDGGSAAEAKSPDPPAAPAAAAAPPAPAPAAAANAKLNLFAELANIDQSSGKTAGLRHVTKDMKSKNRTDAAAAPKPKPKPKAAKKWGQGSAAPKVVKPPLCQLQGTKWAIENQVEMCTLDDVNPRQTAYIYGCNGATIIINGKLNAITLDNCTRTKLLFDNVINACEVVNSKNLQIQVRGLCPSVAIDKVDGILVYLSAESVPVTVFTTSKSSEMNVSFPTEGSDDYTERPIPEQFVHRISGTNVTSDVSDLYSH